MWLIFIRIELFVDSQWVPRVMCSMVICISREDSSFMSVFLAFFYYLSVPLASFCVSPLESVNFFPLSTVFCERPFRIPIFSFQGAAKQNLACSRLLQLSFETTSVVAACFFSFSRISAAALEIPFGRTNSAKSQPFLD